MERVLTTKEDLTDIANSIRRKARTFDKLTYPNGFVSAINDIVGGIEVDPSTVTVTKISGTDDDYMINF